MRQSPSSPRQRPRVCSAAPRHRAITKPAAGKPRHPAVSYPQDVPSAVTSEAPVPRTCWPPGTATASSPSPADRSPRVANSAHVRRTPRVHGSASRAVGEPLPNQRCLLFAVHAVAHHLAALFCLRSITRRSTTLAQDQHRPRRPRRRAAAPHIAALTKPSPAGTPAPYTSVLHSGESRINRCWGWRSSVILDVKG